jgi:hypothetical protein
MMRFAAYYVSTIGCNSNLCILSSPPPISQCFRKKSVSASSEKKCFSECDRAGLEPTTSNSKELRSSNRRLNQ